MKQLLLVGKFTQQFRELNKALASLYEVRTCVNKLEIFDGMFKIKQPDVIVYVIEEKDDSDEDLMEALKKDYKEVPVICETPDVDDEWIKQYMRSHRFIYMPTNYSFDELIDMIEYVLKRKESGEYELDLLCDVGQEEEEQQKIQEADIVYSKATFTKESDKKTLLLVDDSGFSLRTIRGLIGNKYDVRMVTSGIDAISAILVKRPDLILLDYQMPMLDGKQTMEKIKKLDEAKDIPIVFVTSVKDKEHIKAVLDLKPAGYLLKPVDGDRLLQTIEGIIGK